MREIWVIPLLNVDGNQQFWYQHIEAGERNHWDRNEDGVYNIFEGVSLSHNTTIAYQKSPHTLRGPTPNSEPEVQALLSLVKRIGPTLALSLSSQHESLLLPYGISTNLERDLLWKVSQKTLSQYNLSIPILNPQNPNHAGLLGEIFSTTGSSSFAIPTHKSPEKILQTRDFPWCFFPENQLREFLLLEID